MLAQIEEAIIARLGLFAPLIKRADIPRAGVNSIAGPSYMLAIMKGAATAPAMNACKQHVDIALWVRVSNLQNDAARRKGAYPVIEALAQCLFLEKLGLDITAIAYGGFTDDSAPEELQGCVGVFRLDFSTSYTVRKTGDAESEQLLVAGLNVLYGGKTVITGDIQP
ncbi:MAG: hypothetical protein WC421_02805 [Elusimicrobiales bacterium]